MLARTKGIHWVSERRQRPVPSPSPLLFSHPYIYEGLELLRSELIKLVDVPLETSRRLQQRIRVDEGQLRNDVRAPLGKGGHPCV